jgi:hypothetical protein
MLCDTPGLWNSHVPLWWQRLRRREGVERGDIWASCDVVMVEMKQVTARSRSEDLIQGEPQISRVRATISPTRSQSRCKISCTSRKAGSSHVKRVARQLHAGADSFALRNLSRPPVNVPQSKRHFTHDALPLRRDTACTYSVIIADTSALHGRPRHRHIDRKRTTELSQLSTFPQQQLPMIAPLRLAISLSQQ